MHERRAVRLISHLALGRQAERILYRQGHRREPGRAQGGLAVQTNTEGFEVRFLSVHPLKQSGSQRPIIRQPDHLNDRFQDIAHRR